MLKLEAGKKYLTVDGSLVGPLYKEDGYFAFSIDNGKEYIQWNEHGNVVHYGGTGYNFRTDIELMIVKEHTSEKEVVLKSPVSERMVKTINTGKFGPQNGLTVDLSLISFNDNNLVIGIQRKVYSSEELLWFSDTLKEIALSLDKKEIDDE